MSPECWKLNTISNVPVFCLVHWLHDKKRLVVCKLPAHIAHVMKLQQIHAV